MKTFFAALGALLVCVPAIVAGPITVSSYTINTPTEASFPDDTGLQLTDGSFGSIDLSSSAAFYPWVGWLNTNAISMTFNFSSIQSVTSVSIDFLNETQNFVFLPDSVNIGGQVFVINGNALGNPATGFLTFILPSAINTQSLAVELDRASTGFHILIDEVTFDGGTAATGAPEPATFGMIGAGLLGLAFWTRRRPK
jgi:PEP-CTERM motif